jgi:WXG100 family type VII secretion target
VSDPAAALEAPTPSAPIPDIVSTMMHFPDLISPSYWLLVVIEKACGVNPVEWLTEHVSGDWERMSTASSALEHLADFHQVLAHELKSARENFEQNWSGEASTAASAYFKRFEEAVAEQATPLQSIAREVDNVAQGMKSTQETLVSLIGLMLDLAIAAAIELAVAAASSWTVVGGVVAGGSAAYTIVQVAKTWAQIIEVHGKAVTMVDGLIGLTAGFLGSIHGFSTHPLPTGGYNNRLVS